MVSRAVLSVTALCLCLVALAQSALAEYPKPSLYPVSWELEFSYRLPRRIVVQLPDRPATAYWYLPYTVVNRSDDERMFMPIFELVTEDGKVIRSDNNVPRRVFDQIKSREKNQFMEHPIGVSGTIRLGEAQARDSVAIWEEPMPEMGRFSIYVGGLSGESTTVGAGEQKVILRKSLQLNYLIRGDEIYPGEDQINENPKQWVMR